MEAHVSFPRLGYRGPISFLIDTGADGSVLMPVDAKRLGVDFNSLQNPVVSTGIGGKASGFEEICVLSFADNRYIYSYLLNKMEISAPTRDNLRFPSLLGRDILNHWRCVFDISRQIAFCTPRTWDQRQKI
jgi:Aspartyl protease